MDKLMFSIFDTVAEIYEPPFIEINRGTAMRRVTDLMNSNPQSPYAKFPDNYELHYIGTWDEAGGFATSDKPSELVRPLMELAQFNDTEK